MAWKKVLTTGGAITLKRNTSVLFELTGQNDVGWTDLDIDTYATVPSDAIGLMVEAYVLAGTAALPNLSLRKKGDDTNDWQWTSSRAQKLSHAITGLLVVEMDDDHKIQYRLQSTGNNGMAAFYLKLMGWIKG